MLIGIAIAGAFFFTDPCPADSAHGAVVCLTTGCTTKDQPCTPKPAYLVKVIDPNSKKSPAKPPTPRPKEGPAPCADVRPPDSVQTLELRKTYDFTVTFSAQAQPPFSLLAKGATAHSSDPPSARTQTYKVIPQRSSIAFQANVAKTSTCSPVTLALQAEESADCVALDDSFKPAGDETDPPRPAPDAAPDSSKKPSPDVKKLVSLLGNPKPLSLVASGSKILVYSSTLDERVNKQALTNLEDAIKSLSGLDDGSPEHPDKLRQLELPVPRRTTADMLSKLASKQFDLTLEYPGNGTDLRN